MSGAQVVVVGAGAAGLGVAAALSELCIDVRLLERDAIGASFRAWPEEMRFITPSFPSNGFGLPDLNAIVPGSSPAVTLDREHPTGADYANYLEAVADHYELDVETGVDVTDVRPASESTDDTPAGVVVDGGATDGFVLETNRGLRRARFVVWAGGQFGAPRQGPFDGAEQCVHNSSVDSWDDYATAGEEFVVVGGFESGIDAAINLLERGCTVTVLDRGYPWAFDHPDPSERLAPYTVERLETLEGADRLSLVGGVEVERIESNDERVTVVATERHPGDAEPRFEPDSDEIGTQRRVTVPTRPVLATGFEPNLGPVADRFPETDGSIELTERDESPTTPGLFLAGPDVEHRGTSFCFIYKFRTRFPVVAETIGERLGVDTDPLEQYRESNVFLEDLSCCEPDDCRC